MQISDVLGRHDITDGKLTIKVEIAESKNNKYNICITNSISTFIKSNRNLTTMEEVTDFIQDYLTNWL